MQKSFEKHMQNLIVALVLLSYFQFFCFSAIPYSIRILSQPFMCSIMAIHIIIRIIYNPGKTIKMNFATLLTILIIFSFPSIFIALYYHNQSVIGSIWASKLIFFYLLYFYLHLCKISPRFLLRLLAIVGLLAVVFYYLQFFLYPKRIFDIPMLEERGTIRLLIAGMLCTQAAYFYFLNQFFEKNRPIYLILTLLCLSIFILQGTRQFIFSLIFLTLINFVVFRKMKSRLLMFFAITAALVVVFFVFREIFNELTKVSSSQFSNIGGGIRIKAARFYLTDFMPDKAAYIFGNGKPAPGSMFSQKMMLYTLKYGFFTSDIGIIGDYVTYGIIFALTGMALLIKSLQFKVSAKYRFLKYYIYFQSFTLIAGSGIFGGADIVLLIVLYIFDWDRANTFQRPFEAQTNYNQSPLPGNVYKNQLKL